MTLGREMGKHVGYAVISYRARLSTLTASLWLESRLSPSQLRLDSHFRAPSHLPAHPLSLTLARGVLGSVGNGWYAVLKGRYLPLRPARTVLASMG